MEDAGCAVLASVAMVVVFVICIATGSCDVPPADARRVLATEGVSEVQLTGYEFGGCARDEVFSTGFSGMKNGHRITGVVCGTVGAYSVRYH